MRRVAYPPASRSFGPSTDSYRSVGSMSSAMVMPGTAQSRVTVPGQCKLHRSCPQSTLAFTRSSRPARQSGKEVLQSGQCRCWAVALALPPMHASNLCKPDVRPSRAGKVASVDLTTKTQLTDHSTRFVCSQVYCASAPTRQ